jgi:hypothetical protein
LRFNFASERLVESCRWRGLAIDRLQDHRRVDGGIHGLRQPIRFTVADSDSTVSAKLVDLDSEHQPVSEIRGTIWGMQVRICIAGGTNLMRSRYATAPFNDIGPRSTFRAMSLYIIRSLRASTGQIGSRAAAAMAVTAIPAT